MTRRITALALFAASLALVQYAAGQPDPLTAFKVGDKNKDGKLSPDEFLKLVGKNAKIQANPALGKQLFEKLDTNKDGFLSFDEFKAMPGLVRGPATPPIAAAPFNDNPTPEQLAFFEKKIRPVLVGKCYQCHAADAEKVRGGLLLDTRDGLRKGGDGGPVVVAGNPDRSPLVKAIRHADEATKMPPKERLPDAVVADFEAWVWMGAPDPRDGAKIAAKEIDVEKGRQFWAFQKPRKVAPPAVKDAAWSRSDIDRFLLAGLKATGLRPVGDADRRTLVRRVYLDLIGLPPTPEEVEAFVADRSPMAFEKVVDHLLASPPFGERWGRHWLDVARYAETTGKTVNVNHPHAWRYRDWVIAALNADKPYDQFVREQLAGDLLPGGDPRARAERVIATGFLAIGPKALNERNGLQFELDVADEQIDVTTQAFLGITAACARCHDHKFDPIPQKDYYALAGIFRSTETCYGTIRFVQSQRPSPLIPLPAESGAPAAVEKLTAAERKRTEEQIKTIQERKVDQPIQRIFIAGQVAILQSRLDSFDADGNPKLLAMGVRVYEHTRCGLHQKVMIVDGELCTIGSANFDPRSFRINEEISVAILDTKIAAELRGAFDADVQHSEEWTLERWAKMFDLNLRSVFVTMQAVAPMMRAAGGGSIVNVSSRAAGNPAPEVAPYGAAKAGVEYLTATMAAAWGSSGIRVNCVRVGVIESEGYRQAMAAAGPLAQIILSRDTVALLGIGDQFRLTTRAADRFGNTLAQSTNVESNDPTIVTADNFGSGAILTAHASDRTTTVLATAGSVQKTGTVVVLPPPCGPGSQSFSLAVGQVANAATKATFCRLPFE